MELYKVLDGRKSCNGGEGMWRIGRWMPPVDGELVPCENGYHLCRREDLICWLGPNIFIAEHRGDIVECDEKVVVREARITKELKTWNERTARLFAADCAEHVLYIYEKLNDSKAPAHAIQEARDYANGLITLGEMAAASEAASEAAMDAAWEAARDAAVDAAWAAARDAARAAAWAAAGDDAAWEAARNAGWAAGWAAARADELGWKTERLFQYLNGEI